MLGSILDIVEGNSRPQYSIAELERRHDHCECSSYADSGLCQFRHKGHFRFQYVDKEIYVNKKQKRRNIHCRIQLLGSSPSSDLKKRQKET